ncbi:MAG: fibronectin type III domain-containing protein, partial [Clostridiaceae bacterium]|nr:fibronectin type III domain-containing protein [Clostridiaceae bacterium]
MKKKMRMLSFFVLLLSFTIPGNQINVKAASDVTPPSAVTGLRSPAKTSSSISLSWNASSDNVGVEAYYIYKDGVCWTSTTSTSYTFTNLSSTSTYRFTVEARDAVGNRSVAGNLSVTISDVAPPTAVTGLNSPAKTISSIGLSWNASSDNVGVEAYYIYKDGVCWTSTTSTSYTFTNLSPNSTYQFTVEARDIVGNRSPGNSLSISTLSDTTAPTAITGLSSPAKTSSSISLSWNASSDNVGVGAYYIYKDGVCWTSTTSTSYTFTNLSPNSTYQFTVEARDAAGNRSVGGNLSVSIGDVTPPTAITGLSSPTKTSTSVSLSWNASSDNVGVEAYYIYKDGVCLTSTTLTSYTFTNLSPNSTYQFTVEARDVAGNRSPGNSLSISTLSDTTPPTAVTGLSSPAKTSSSISLSWNASSDNVGVGAYYIYKDGVCWTSTTSTSYTFTNLSPNSTYQFTVEARDAVGNRSVGGNLSVSIGDVTSPTAITGLSSPAKTSSSVSLSWNPSSDNVGVAAYYIYKDGVCWTSTTSTSY